LPFASAVVVALAPPLSVTVAPAALFAGLSVPEMLSEGEGDGDTADDVTPVLPHPADTITANAENRQTNPL